MLVKLMVNSNCPPAAGIWIGGLTGVRVIETGDSDRSGVMAMPCGKQHIATVATTVLLAVVLGTRFSGQEGIVYESLADEVLAHVSHEPSALQVTDVTVTDAHLYEVVPANIAQLDHSAGLITFAESCPINGNIVPHLVIQGERGPVTILLMPEEKVSAAVLLNDERSHGVILPVGEGSIAIVGPRGESLEQIERRILQSVMWST